MAKRQNKSQLLKESKKRAFLDSFRELGNVSLAARCAEINRGTHYKWFSEDSEYADRFSDAKEDAADALEAEARRRAVEGVEKPVGWYQGTAGGTIQEYSDTLLIFLLKGVRPEKYVERYELSGKDGAPIEFTIDISGDQNQG